MKRVVCCSLFVLSVASIYGQTPVDIEVGYRFFNVSGNEAMYRTQINERSGFLIRSLTWAGSDTQFTDWFRVDASDLGVGPAGSLRIDAGKNALYRFTLGYRQTNAFSDIPALALGQHTYDRDRQLVDADLELDKWARITPFIGFTWNHYYGPGTTTRTLGGDDFQLDSNLKNRDTEWRLGFGFNYKMFTGQLTQGWRSFDDHETLTLTPNSGAGNNNDPILGRQISASTITRDDHAEGHTPFTNFYTTAQVNSKVKVIADYVRSAAKSESDSGEGAAGSFVSFEIARFFNGLNSTVDGNARNTTWRGGARAEWSVTPQVDLFADAHREHRALQGAALIDDIYLQTVNFAGLDPKDVETILNSKNALERTEDVFAVAGSAKALGPFAVRAGVSESKQNVDLSPDLSEIVVPGPSQGGTFSRRVTSFDVSGSYAKSGFLATAWWRHDTANDPIMRTDFLNRDRFRLRGGWRGLSDRLRLGVTAEENHPKNDRSGFDYDAKIRQLSADGEFGVTSHVTVRAAYAALRADSSILYRHPETFATDTSINKEDGNSAEAGVILTFAPVSFDASYLRFKNTGTNPFTVDRYHLRASTKLIRNTGLTAEWDRDKYNEPDPGTGDFQGDRLGIYIHWVR